MKNALIFIFILFCTAVQAQTTPAKCTATTKAGTACKRNAVAPSTLCTAHNPNTPKCGAPTKAGAPCKRTVKTTGQHCAVHTSTPKK